MSFDSISPANQNQLDEQGFVILPDLIPDDLASELRRRIDELFDIEGSSAGAEFKQEAGCRRLANLVNKGKVFQRVIAFEAVLQYVRHVLGPDIKLSSLNVRSVNPGCELRQPLHADMGAVPDEQGNWVCNTVWMLEDITAANGVIRVVPGTHRSGRLPQDALADPRERHPDETILTGRSGTVIVINAHLWHGGLENHTSDPRTALHAFYCRRDKPQQQYQKRLLDPRLQSELSAKLRDLLALDDPLNDRLSSDVKTRSGFMK